MPSESQGQRHDRQSGAVTVDTAWQKVADELAGALRTTMLRNPNLAVLDWDRATTALAHYEEAAGGEAPDPGTPSAPGPGPRG